MSKGLGRNKQGNSEDHDKIGKGIRRAGIKVAAGPAQGNPMPSPKPPAWPTNPKGERKYMNKGGSVKKRKGYRHGGVVHEMTNKPVEVAYTTEESLRRAGIK